ncbi:hypothetical protein NHQ30_006993 [Ciborinia camelliae]|nr:hypothetical protein NHQ30_006993 [Ciborinia camelliae]
MDSLPAGVDLSTIPLAINPNGNPPNFINPPSLDSAVLGVGVTLIIISLSLLCIRLFTNLKTTGSLGLDDYLCLGGELGGIAYWAVVYSLARAGAARHAWDVPASIVTKSFIKRQFVQQMIIAPTIWAVKAAIAALYIRIFGTVRWLRLTAYGLIIFMFLFYGSNVIIAAVYCIPRSGAPWDETAFARFAEVFGTVSVSCAPALSSFWLKIFTQTQFYHSFRSLQAGLLSRVSLTEDRNVQADGDKYGSTSNLKKQHTYNELDTDTLNPGRAKAPHTKVYSSTPEIDPIPLDNIITKSTQIEQSSRSLGSTSTKTGLSN